MRGFDDRTNHTVPTGRFPYSRGYQAINCLATIILSLRDKVQQDPKGLRLV